MAKSHFINRCMDHIYRPIMKDEMPKANQIWLVESMRKAIAKVAQSTRIVTVTE